MIPLIDSTKTTGLIFFPGTMVGMLLAGAAPVDAVRLQLILLYILLGSVALGALTLPCSSPTATSSPRPSNSANYPRKARPHSHRAGASRSLVQSGTTSSNP